MDADGPSSEGPRSLFSSPPPPSETPEHSTLARVRLSPPLLTGTVAPTVFVLALDRLDQLWTYTSLTWGSSLAAVIEAVRNESAAWLPDVWLGE